MNVRIAVALIGTVAVATATPVQALPGSDVNSACEVLRGTVDTEQVCHVHEAAADYYIAFTFPVDYPDQQTLTDELTERRDQFVAFATEHPPRDHPHMLDATAQTYRSGTSSAGTRSIVFTVYSDSGGAHPVTSFSASTFDVGARVPVTFETLFAADTRPVDALNTIVSQKWRKFSADYGPLGENPQGAQLYRDFALTDDAVLFFIDQGAWLPQAAGPQRISISRSDLASILA
jgi:hypothetical protein